MEKGHTTARDSTTGQLVKQTNYVYAWIWECAVPQPYAHYTHD
jgi:hypothetical protein